MIVLCVLGPVTVALGEGVCAVSSFVSDGLGEVGLGVLGFVTVGFGENASTVVAFCTGCVLNTYTSVVLVKFCKVLGACVDTSFKGFAVSFTVGGGCIKDFGARVIGLRAVGPFAVGVCLVDFW